MCVITTDFSHCTIEFWFASMSMKKKLKIGYDAWTNYFSPMIQKLDEYISKYPTGIITAGKLKIALTNMFAKVIKERFWKGGNDIDSKPPIWDGYQLAGSYMVSNKEYLNTFFKNKGIDSVFETEYWTNEYFLDKEQLEALNIESANDLSTSEFERFNMPGWMPVLKEETWDIDPELFFYEETSMGLKDLDGKTTVQFRFADKTIEELKKALHKYSSLDKIPYYSGRIALSFCTMLSDKLVKEFKLDETVAMQVATYIYKYRNDEIDTWGSLTIIHIEADFYWFEKNMEEAYEKMGNSFDSFRILKEWPW